VTAQSKKKGYTNFYIWDKNNPSRRLGIVIKDDKSNWNNPSAFAAHSTVYRFTKPYKYKYGGILNVINRSSNIHKYSSGGQAEVIGNTGYSNNGKLDWNYNWDSSLFNSYLDNILKSIDQYKESKNTKGLNNFIDNLNWS
jgi:hypothetical protein